jgi:hypothetical protein
VSIMQVVTVRSELPERKRTSNSQMNGASYRGNSACRSSNQQSNKYYGLTRALPDQLVGENEGKSRPSLTLSGVKSGCFNNHSIVRCVS